MVHKEEAPLETLQGCIAKRLKLLVSQLLGNRESFSLTYIMTYYDVHWGLFKHLSKVKIVSSVRLASDGMLGDFDEVVFLRLAYYNVQYTFFVNSPTKNAKQTVHFYFSIGGFIAYCLVCLSYLISEIQSIDSRSCHCYQF